MTVAEARQIALLVERAIVEERDACAALAESAGGELGREIAARIRARMVPRPADHAACAVAGRGR